MSHLPIWYIGQVPLEDCDKAFAEYMQIPPRDASMGNVGDVVDHAQRNTTVRFSSADHWFDQKMKDYGVLANKECKWDFDVDRCEAVQFAEYGVGQKYNWHIDTFPLTGLATDRKVTVVCLLSDPAEYEGGNLQLKFYGEHTPVMRKGTIIAFPSFIEHQVTPVTKGVRYTATIWISGPRFR